MSLRRVIGALLAVSGGVVAAVAAPAASPPASPTPSAGLYGATDAAAGAALYSERCAMCHGRSLEGTHEVPALTGRFVANWAGRPVGDLSAYVGRAMPQFAPGSLSPDETGQVVAFILQSNGYPAASGTGPAGAAKRPETPLPPPPLPR